MSVFELRPHHGLCIAFFEGKGYSPEFVRHMIERIAYLHAYDPEIRLVLHTDEICQACPHNQNHICESNQKVLDYDRQILTLCGLRENQCLHWTDLQELVFLHILKKTRLKEVCQSCQWLEICLSKKAVLPDEK